MKCQFLILFSAAFLFILSVPHVKCDDEAEEAVEPDPAKLDYAKGSMCKYCDYCKFCKLCDADCPCETSQAKPNCNMCKYCKFCYLCKVCDTVCTAGGIVDRVSAAIVNALPIHDTKEIDNDISTVQNWIDKKRDEL